MPDRKLAAVEKNISDVQQKDIRVALTGTVIAVENGQAMLDDGSGKIMVAAQDGISAGQTVRVIGRVIAKEEKFEIQTEIIQNLQNLDLNLFRKVSDMWRQNVQINIG